MGIKSLTVGLVVPNGRPKMPCTEVYTVKYIPKMPCTEVLTGSQFSFLKLNQLFLIGDDTYCLAALFIYISSKQKRGPHGQLDVQ
jgi:hypothetical protein